MGNTKINADGYALSVWWALPNAFSNWKKPTVTELNAALNVTSSVAWDSYSFGAQASNQISDPTFIDVGNVQTRGFAQFGGSISFLYPHDYTDTSNDYLNTFQAFDQPRTLGYVVIRADGLKTTTSAGDVSKVAVANDFIYIYKVISDGYADSITGENSYKYAITFKPQGDLWANAVVATSVTVVTPVAIGAANYASPTGKTPLATYITGRQLDSVASTYNGYPGWFTWTSSNTAHATVDQNGVVTAVAAGAANITATWAATGTASTALAVTIT